MKSIIKNFIYISILFSAIFFLAHQTNAANLQIGAVCEPGADVCVSGQCMPSSCNVAEKTMIFKCYDPNETYLEWGNKTRAEIQFNTDEIGMCQDGKDPTAAWESRIKGGNQCTSNSDCTGEGQKCLATDCDYTNKTVTYTCTTGPELLNESDKSKCQAGTLKAQVDLEGQCAAKAPPESERGIFTKGLSALCVGCGVCSQRDVFQEVINIVAFIYSIVGGLAVVVLIIGAIMYMTAAGSQERVQLAKRAMTAAVIGLVIVLVAVILINVILNLLGIQNTGSFINPTLAK